MDLCYRDCVTNCSRTRIYEEGCCGDERRRCRCECRCRDRRDSELWREENSSEDAQSEE